MSIRSMSRRLISIAITTPLSICRRLSFSMSMLMVMFSLMTSFRPVVTPTPTTTAAAILLIVVFIFGRVTIRSLHFGSDALNLLLIVRRVARATSTRRATFTRTFTTLTASATVAIATTATSMTTSPSTPTTFIATSLHRLHHTIVMFFLTNLFAELFKVEYVSVDFAQ